MGLLNLFRPRQKEINESDPLYLDLSRMKTGYFVNYDLKTFEVNGYAEYDWGDGYITQEWELADGEKLLYLEREKDDKVYWELSEEVKNIEVNKIFDYIKENEDPPEELDFSSRKYFLDESGAGHFCRDGKRPGVECIMWFYSDEHEKNFFSIYQWGENDFTAYKGTPVEEYQFTEITPGGNHE